MLHFVYTIVKRMKLSEKQKSSNISRRKKRLPFLYNSPFELDTFIIKIQEAVVLVQMTFLMNNTSEVL